MIKTAVDVLCCVALTGAVVANIGAAIRLRDLRKGWRR